MAVHRTGAASPVRLPGVRPGPATVPCRPCPGETAGHEAMMASFGASTHVHMHACATSLAVVMHPRIRWFGRKQVARLLVASECSDKSPGASCPPQNFNPQGVEVEWMGHADPARSSREPYISGVKSRGGGEQERPRTGEEGT
jgi:hypothetical protein